MFLNFTNHSSNNWSVEQVAAAEKYGKILDMSFPSIDPHMTSNAVEVLADKYAKDIYELKPECVMCQGEFCFTYAIVKRLKDMHIKVVAACSERVVEEQITDKETKKVSIFKFVQFREY